MQRYQATATVLWEVDSEDEKEVAALQAAKQFEAMLTKPSDMETKVSVRVDRLKSTQNNIVLGVFKCEDVFPYLTKRKDKRLYSVDGKNYLVRMNSHRYFVFNANRRCVCCGLEGTKMVLEMHPGHEMPHFNLYGIGDDGRPVMLTKDHIQAKAHGGEDRYSNYQTMCSTCNNLKAAANLTLDALKELRAVYEDNKETSRKRLATIIDTARRKLSTPRPADTTFVPKPGRLKLLAAQKGKQKIMVPNVDLNIWQCPKGVLVGRSVYEPVEPDQLLVACIRKGQYQEVIGSEKARVACRFQDDKPVMIYQGYLDKFDESYFAECA